MQNNLSKELLANLRDWIEEGKDTSIQEVLADVHPADIAELINELRRDEAVYLYRILEEERAAEVMLELDEDVREKLLSSLTSREIAEDLIENIDSDDAADILQDLPEPKDRPATSLTS
jgi:magnesium transporter